MRGSEEPRLVSFYKKIEDLNTEGPLESFLKLIPGLSMSKIPNRILKVSEDRLQDFKAILDSMTKEELKDPSIINKSRRERISEGAGVEQGLIRKLLSKHREVKRKRKMSKEEKRKKFMRKIR